jgi:hypothetical protein
VIKETPCSNKAIVDDEGDTLYKQGDSKYLIHICDVILGQKYRLNMAQF